MPLDVVKPLLIRSNYLRRRLSGMRRQKSAPVKMSSLALMVEEKMKGFFSSPLLVGPIVPVDSGRKTPPPQVPAKMPGSDISIGRSARTMVYSRPKETRQADL